MESRYLFRGKRTDNGEWVEWNILEGIPHDTHILKSTICQCTGLKDKNGKLIWENDIIRCICGTAVVIWDKSEWRIKWIDKSVWRRDLNYWVNERKYKVEVIGNTFDNPELLEV